MKVKQDTEDEEGWVLCNHLISQLKCYFYRDNSGDSDKVCLKQRSDSCEVSSNQLVVLGRI